MQSPLLLTALAVAAAVPMAAQASDDGAELWLNPAVEFALDNQTAIELETAQRFRRSADGRPDTYFVRLWLAHDVGSGLTLSGAAERRVNDGGANETRFIQQLSGRHGIVRTRLRLEQRLVDGAAQTGLRVRPRLGVSVPLDRDKRWLAGADAELALTLRATSPTGATGLTGLRTQIGITHKISDNWSATANYLRQQDIRVGRADAVGHAPLIAITRSF